MKSWPRYGYCESLGGFQGSTFLPRFYKMCRFFGRAVLLSAFLEAMVQTNDDFRILSAGILTRKVPFVVHRLGEISPHSMQV